jgi:hypothetical protein
VSDPPTSRSQMANFMTFPMTAKTQVSGNDIVIGTDKAGSTLASRAF